MNCENEYDYYIWKSTDIEHDNFVIRGGFEIMHREKINIFESDLMVKDMESLIDYVWQGEYLIPLEMIGTE